MKLAVFPATASAIEVTEQAVRVLDAVLPGVEQDAVRPRRRPVAPHRRGAAGLGAGRAAPARRDPARRGGRPVRALRRAGARAAAAAALRARPLREPAPGQALPGCRHAAGRATRPIDFVVYREGTEGPYAGNGGVLRSAPRTRSRPRSASTPPSGSSGSSARRSRRARPRPRKHLTLVHKNNVLVYAGDLWFRTLHRVAEEYPDIESPTTTSTPPRSTWSPTRAATTSSSPTTCSATSSPIWRPRWPAASGWPPAATSNPAAHDPVDVRARARLGARHRRAGQGRSDRGDPVGVDAAGPPGTRRRGGAGRGGRRGGPRRRATGDPGATSEIGERIASAAAH